jgi:hypothetical protein
MKKSFVVIQCQLHCQLACKRGPESMQGERECIDSALRGMANETVVKTLVTQFDKPPT